MDQDKHLVRASDAQTSLATTSGPLIKSYDAEPRAKPEVPLINEAQARRLAIDEQKLRITKSLETVQAELRAIGRQSNEAQDALYKAKAAVDDLKHWQDWVRANPWRSVGIAAALGLGLGLF